MGESIQIYSFLTEREGRYKPGDKHIQKLQRLNKIDFTGIIHLSSKPTKTDMIIVYPGDLVISGINVAKGAIAIWDGDNPITATIYYSTYTFDKEIINFVHKAISAPFNRLCFRNSAKGAQKTMPKITQGIVSNALVPLPPLAEQCAVVDRVEKSFAIIDTLKLQTRERKEQAEGLVRAAFGK